VSSPGLGDNLVVEYSGFRQLAKVGWLTIPEEQEGSHATYGEHRRDADCQLHAALNFFVTSRAPAFRGPSTASLAPSATAFGPSTICLAARS
jgi:hypothetical protein